MMQITPFEEIRTVPMEIEESFDDIAETQRTELVDKFNTPKPKHNMMMPNKYNTNPFIKENSIKNRYAIISSNVKKYFNSTNDGKINRKGNCTQKFQKNIDLFGYFKVIPKESLTQKKVGNNKLKKEEVANNGILKNLDPNPFRVSKKKYNVEMPDILNDMDLEIGPFHCPKNNAKDSLFSGKIDFEDIFFNNISDYDDKEII